MFSTFLPQFSVIWHEVPTRPQHCPSGSQIRDSPPFFIPLCEIFGPDKWPGDRPENVLCHTKDPSSDIVIADFGMYVALTCLRDMPLTCMSHNLPAPSTLNPLESSIRPSQASLGYVPPELLSLKGMAACQPLVYRVLLPPPLTEARFKLHTQYWKNVADEGMLRAISNHLCACENPLL